MLLYFVGASFARELLYSVGASFARELRVPSHPISSNYAPFALKKSLFNNWVIVPY